MSWELALQSVTVAFATIGGWFLYDLVSEFKSYKKESHIDIVSLKQERADFKNTVRASELSIKDRVNQMQAVHTDFSSMVNESLLKIRNEIDKLSEVSKDAHKKAEKLDETMTKTFRLFKHFDQEIKSIKVELEKVTIFKSGK